MKRSILLGLLLFFFAHGQVFGSFKDNTPFFYASLAEASYAKNGREAQIKLDRLLGKGLATVLKHHKIVSTFRSSTIIILVKDAKGKFHVAFEGSNDIGDWLGNVIINPTRGAFYKYDVTKKVDQKMHTLMMNWKKQVGSITAIIGHSRGGMFASQVPHKHSRDYRGTQVITFNSLKPKAASNQLHLAIKNERVSTLLSSNGRYKKLNIGRGQWRLYSNHKMKFFLSGLKDKDWTFVL